MLSFEQLLNQANTALETCYVAQANGDVNAPDDIYYVAEMLLELGIGAVLVPTPTGRLAWLDLTTLEF